MSNVEKRLAELEKGLKASTNRAKAAEERATAAERELKELKARSRDKVVELAAENRQLRTMRDLTGPESPYANDSRETYERLKRDTVKTRDGQRHYYTETDAYVNGLYIKGDSVVSIPADQDPSVTWKPVKVGGKDAKTGALIFVPIETELDDGKEVDPSQQIDDGGAPVTNTELNTRAAAGRQRAGQRGAGAPPAPTPPERPGALEPEASAEPSNSEPRPSDTDVG
jgi:hypothetical protein